MTEELQQQPVTTQQTETAQLPQKVTIDLSDPDIIEHKTGKTLYEVGIWELLWRNFLAGISRGLGNLLLFILFFLILGNLFMTYVWPYMEPIVDSFYTSSELVDFIKDYVDMQGQQ